MKVSLYYTLLLVFFVSRDAAADSCTSSGNPNDVNVCKNCATVYDCRENPVEEIDCLGCNMVCGDSASFATCYKGFDTNVAANISNKECLCKSDEFGNLLNNGNYSDPFDPLNSYVTCTGGIPSYHTCPSQTVFDSTTCVPGTSCPDNYTNPYFETPMYCNYYIDCSDGTAKECDPATEIFDMNNVGDTPDQCVDPLDGVCATPGLIQHPSVCYMSVTCNSALELVNHRCCPRGQYYNPLNFDCELDSTGCSSTVGLCIQEYWEQYLCNSCNATLETYATRKICSKFYYECEDRGDGLLPYLHDCPDTYPVWDPVNNFCNLESEVEEC